MTIVIVFCASAAPGAISVIVDSAASDTAVAPSGGKLVRNIAILLSALWWRAVRPAVLAELLTTSLRSSYASPDKSTSTAPAVFAISGLDIAPYDTRGCVGPTFYNIAATDVMRRSMFCSIA
jgi:hypothetical protein